MADQLLLSTGVALILIGFAIMLVTLIWLAALGVKGGRDDVKSAGAVIIGPIPIVFGTDKESVKIILILSIALVVLLLVLMMFSNELFSFE